LEKRVAMRRAFLSWIVVVTVGASSCGVYAQADFYLEMEECKTTLGYIGPSDEALATVSADNSVFACSRASQEITCIVRVGAEEGTTTASFTVDLDSPPYLYFQNSNGSDFFAINLTNHRVVAISRYVSEYIVGSKVCRGSYLTASEVDAVQRPQ